MIYIVTRGEYSDYHVVAATTNHDIAEKIAEKFSDNDGWDDCKIEEFPDAEILLKNVWTVCFDKGGNVCKCELSNSEYDYREIGKVCDLTWKRYYDMYINVESDTQEGAIKIAAEKRAKYLAEKNGL